MTPEETIFYLLPWAKISVWVLVSVIGLACGCYLAAWILDLFSIHLFMSADEVREREMRNQVRAALRKANRELLKNRVRRKWRALRIFNL